MQDQEYNTPANRGNDARSQDNLRRIMGYQLVANELHNRRKQHLAELKLDAGEKLNITTAWGESLGSVSRGKTAYKAVVEDESVALGSAHESDMEWQVVGDDDELIDFLLSTPGGERFLTTRLSEEAVKRMSTDALNTWRRTGKAPAGWRITESTPSPRATASKLAKDMAADFLNRSDAQLALNPTTSDDEENQ